MSQEIIKVLDNLAQKFGIAIDWTNQNILPYLQDLMGRYISLQNTYAIIWIVITAIILIASFIIAYKSIKELMNKSKLDEDYNIMEDESIHCLLLILSVISIIIFAIIFCANIFGLLQNIFTPEITILNYLKTINLGG